jgi:hypothetical protein
VCPFAFQLISSYTYLYALSSSPIHRICLSSSTSKRPYFCSQVRPFASLSFRRMLISTFYPALPSVDSAPASSSASKKSSCFPFFFTSASLSIPTLPFFLPLPVSRRLPTTSFLPSNSLLQKKDRLFTLSPLRFYDPSLLTIGFFSFFLSSFLLSRRQCRPTSLTFSTSTRSSSPPA